MVLPSIPEHRVLGRRVFVKEVRRATSTTVLQHTVQNLPEWRAGACTGCYFEDMIRFAVGCASKLLCVGYQWKPCVCRWGLPRKSHSPPAFPQTARLQTAAGGVERQGIEPGQHELVFREGLDGRGAERGTRREEQEEKTLGSMANGGGGAMELGSPSTLAYRQEKVSDVPRALLGWVACLRSTVERTPDRRLGAQFLASLSVPKHIIRARPNTPFLYRVVREMALWNGSTQA